ncbi:gluconate 2-dehydrogenase subunit 3 family protein [Stakelama saccharophila]|uniref:Gluconate 2-dehydrogenase subunit 3 family protein n=1 Tax=Stakelama saccharophila TaxID=3075605 RepID=A0ABZ0B9L2_9SPHN|nr:gluconate 2-dehydrogenase subunit 3 family protein [Stakelama sp. W311]WNO54058.1 gluconate 2-dehydrogenase subunit 3 family protein [Stakelama sp. W311]
MSEPFPDYDVLAKRDTPSWNAPTREAIDARMARVERSDILSERQRETLRAVVARITPQPKHRAPTNATALVLDKIAGNSGDGFRHHRLPQVREAWERGLDAIEAEARHRFDTDFAHCSDEQQDAVLSAVEQDEVRARPWEDLPANLFWSWRLIPDIVSAYYSHPSAWSAMGFGGPASPRGYVRLTTNHHDPWEASERRQDQTLPAEVRNRHGN